MGQSILGVGGEFDPVLRKLHFRVSGNLSGNKKIFNRGVPPPLPHHTLRWDSSVCWDMASSRTLSLPPQLLSALLVTSQFHLDGRQGGQNELDPAGLTLYCMAEQLRSD
ncbi:unnamed protein product [Pleuronectes platessa]|uniref:Uncharacterized protein n=1 Tax=Pleuronectes platessa TaxID=8262 RepID=A0A9N7V1E3_PLEPL|nr:unnamed protein product [Pleuronectes platessa]